MPALQKEGGIGTKYKYKWDKQYLYWGITAFCVIAASILLYLVIVNFPIIREAVGKVLSAFFPITLGFIIAYLLNPIRKLYELNLFYPVLKKKKKPVKDVKKLSHTLAVICTILTFLLALFLLFYLIIPTLYKSIIQLASELDTYYQKITKWLDNLLSDYPEIMTMVNNTIGNVSNSVEDFFTQTIIPLIGDYMEQITNGVINVISTIKDIIVGLIVAVYVMLYQKKLLIYSKKAVVMLFPAKRVNRVFSLAREADRIFSGYISGKILDSIIIGILCFILMTILRIPYAVLISVLVGVTNIIPVFGPFIGAIPSCLLLLIVNPWKALSFIIMILILQQFDGNVLGPKILGDSTGINAFWIVVVILVGGSLFGVTGMIIGIPVFAFIYGILKDYFTRKLTSKNGDQPNHAYEDLKSIDLNSGAMVLESRYPTDEEIADHSLKKSFLLWIKKGRDKVLGRFKRFKQKK